MKRKRRNLLVALTCILAAPLLAFPPSITTDDLKPVDGLMQDVHLWWTAVWWTVKVRPIGQDPYHEIQPIGGKTYTPLGEGEKGPKRLEMK